MKKIIGKPMQTNSKMIELIKKSEVNIKEAELKKLIDEGYNDPEKLAKEIARAFGLENG